LKSGILRDAVDVYGSVAGEAKLQKQTHYSPGPSGGHEARERNASSDSGFVKLQKQTHYSRAVMAGE
jgi:hypothetical protein